MSKQQDKLIELKGLVSTYLNRKRYIDDPRYFTEVERHILLGSDGSDASLYVCCDHSMCVVIGLRLVSYSLKGVRVYEEARRLANIAEREITKLLATKSLIKG